MARGVITSLLDAHKRVRQGIARGKPGGVLIAQFEPARTTSLRLVEVVACANRHDRPTVAFRADTNEASAARQRARQAGRQVIGLWSANLNSPPKFRAEDTEALRLFERQHAQGASIMVIVGTGTGRSPVIRGYVWQPRRSVSGEAVEISLVR